LYTKLVPLLEKQRQFLLSSKSSDIASNKIPFSLFFSIKKNNERKNSRKMHNII